jgi:hypothetical protein
MSCKILIFTTVSWTSTARHAAGFALAGCTVDALAPLSAPVRLSRHVSTIHRYRSLTPLRSLREAIRRAAPDLIVSCDDRAVQCLLNLYGGEAAGSAIAKLIERSLGDPREYAGVMSREASMRAAAALGIRTPQILSVPDASSLESCLDAIGLPAVLKSDGTWGGEGVEIVKTREEACTAFARLANPPSLTRSIVRAVRRGDGHCLARALAPRARMVSIQKFVRGQPAASAFASWKGAVVGAVYYDVLKADGIVGPPSIIRRVDCPEINDATTRIARHFGLSGLHGLDFIRDDTGHVHLLEINPRATQGGTLPFGQGRDLAAALAGCISQAATPRPAIQNDTVVFFPGEWLKDPASFWLPNAHHEVPWDDPEILRSCLHKAVPKARRAITLSAREAKERPGLPIGAPARA